MVRVEMKLLVYLVVLLVCFGAERCKADWGKSIEQKRKFVSISNKAKGEAVFQCKSNKGNLNKTLKAGEKIRWGMGGEAGPAMICHVDLGGKGGRGYLCMFVEEECNKECKWRVFDGGVLKLKVSGGEWKAFQLMADEESARNYDKDDSCDEDDDVGPGNGKQGSGGSGSPESPAPAPSPVTKSKAEEGVGGKLEYPKWESPAPAPANSRKWISPAPLSESRAPPPTKHKERKLKPRNPRSGMLAPMNDKTESRMKHAKGNSVMKSRHKLKPRNPRSAPAPAPASWKTEPTKQMPQQGGGGGGGEESDAQLPPLPPPGSTFYTCIKEDSR